ncbi:MAG TPA: hypothetical protein VLI41_06395 [Phenylobacterium sp.]|uniref:hypothetical protein n=1 Tax=Phenylobacterium sp. TaxID=1871053 RepID=UPI002C8732CC|nr:hypothetical protein [Phenylobacterium sp.]HSV02819.1 hypothetical protein [Phenylobacterium sp.]
MLRVRPFAALLLAATAAACAPTLGPPPPGYPPPAAPGMGEPAFRAHDFAWSQQPGPNAIVGRLAYQRGATRYTCAGAIVILTPETTWSRRRMEVLYLSSERAALPADEVRARTAEAPPGDSSPYIKRATCDSTDRFSFAHLPDGAWYVITIGRPLKGAGPSLALMRRVVTRGGRTVTIGL